MTDGMMRVRLAILIAAVVSIAGASGTANGQDRTWINPAGGGFADGANWDPIGAPGVNDQATFDLGGPYVVTFSLNATNKSMLLDSDEVEFSLAGRTYTTESLIVGDGTGNHGEFTLTGGTFSLTSPDAEFGRIGKDIGAEGDMTVSTGALLSSTEQIIVGDAGLGTLAVMGGGDAVLANVFVADDLGAVGSIEVSGAGSSASTSGQLFVGNGGSGVLTVSGGGTMNAQGQVRFGDNAGSSGSLVVQDGGSSLACAAACGIGRLGQGSVSVLGGGTMSVAGLTTLGDNVGAEGSILVQGPGSMLVLSAETFIGNFASGSMDLASGATANTTRVKIGDETGSVGAVTVTGAGTTWNDSVEIFVGNRGTGTLDVTGGGDVTAAAVTIGDDPGAAGTATVSGAGSTWATTSLLKVGDLGGGTLRVVDGGQVTAGSYTQGAAGTLEVVLGPSSVDAVVVSGGAVLSGELSVELAPGFTPPGGTTFTIIDAGSLSGGFSVIQAGPDLEVTVTGTSVTATMTGDMGTPGDVNGDGVVDVQDLVEVIIAWGTADPAADLNDDGVVDVQDLVLVIVNWS